MRFYGAIGMLILLAALGTTIFVQKQLIELATTKMKVAESAAAVYKGQAEHRQERIETLTRSLTEREHELERSRIEAARYHVRADALARDDCLDRSVPADLDRLLRDAFPPVAPGAEAAQPGSSSPAAPGVDGDDVPGHR